MVVDACKKAYLLLVLLPLGPQASLFCLSFQARCHSSLSNASNVEKEAVCVVVHRSAADVCQQMASFPVEIVN